VIWEEIIETYVPISPVCYCDRSDGTCATLARIEASHITHCCNGGYETASVIYRLNRCLNLKLVNPNS
jgi:lysyl-tRNA synthetase class I